MKTRTLIIGIIAIMVLLMVIFTIKLNTPKIPKIKSYFTPEPETWVEDNVLSEDPNDVIVDVMRATDQHSSFSWNKQEYFQNGKEDAFFSHGYYKGNSFTGLYANPLPTGLDTTKLSDAELTQKIKENTLMEITNKLNPNDNIIQGFIMGKSTDTGYIFYVFVDLDWKNLLRYTNIIYGEDYNNEATLKQRDFIFTEIKPGIYMDVIEADSNWYDSDPVTGGIIVGEMTLTRFNANDFNSTFIEVR